MASGNPIDAEARLRRFDGEYRWFLCRPAPARDETGKIIAWYGTITDIEDRKRAEDALRASETRLSKAERELQHMLDTIPTLIVRGATNGYIEYLNKQWFEYTGSTHETARGFRWQESLHPDDKDRLVEFGARFVATAEPGDCEARLRRHDGVYRWFLFRPAPARDEAGNFVGWYGTVTDIEDRKTAEAALLRSEAIAAEAQKLSLTGSFAWDPVNDDHYWSEQTFQILGYDRTVELSTDLLVQRVHPDDRHIFKYQLSRAALGQESYDYELRVRMPDGATKQVHVLAHRLKYPSGKEEVVGALMDVTKARKAQETLDAAQTALAHASRVATLGEISATIAHEVNQPLAAIVANGQACSRILRRETPDLDDVRDAVDWIVKDGIRAGEVIGRVRGLLKHADTQKAPLDVNETINEVTTLLQRELAMHQVTLRRELAPAMPLAFADRIHLQQVIINLMMNGMEAMEAITDRPRVMVVQSHWDEAQITVAVKDSGVGIPPETKDRLFDAFFSTKPSGLGMGLSICRSIIEDHGGELRATDNGGFGATFQFTLPSYRTS